MFWIYALICVGLSALCMVSAWIGAKMGLKWFTDGMEEVIIYDEASETEAEEEEC